MNDSDPLILYTDAFTRAVGGVLMQMVQETSVQGGKEKPCVFVSHTPASNEIGGDGTRTVCLRVLCQESCSIST